MKHLPLQFSVHAKYLLLVMIWLAACQPTQEPPVTTSGAKQSASTPVQETPVATKTPEQYPSIPIPSGVFYQGAIQDLAEIDFYADAKVYPTKSGAASYADLLKQHGWEACVGAQCDFVHVTDTRFLGTYQYGQGPQAPLITIGVNMMIKPGEQTTLFLKNCGTITETQDADLHSKDGCVVILPTDLASPVPKN